MKHLILVRHAKSSWQLDVRDEDRPLKEKGILRAEKIAKHLRHRIDFDPDLWMTSYANRALHTASIFAKEFGVLNQLQINSNLYTFSKNSLVKAVQNISDECYKAIVFGHNEAITNFANSLGTKIIDNVPTAGVVYIVFRIKSWKEIKQGETQFIIIPKEI